MPDDDWFETDAYPAAGFYFWRRDEKDDSPEYILISCGLVWNQDGKVTVINGGQWRFIGD
jgi:hypothetical protein